MENPERDDSTEVRFYSSHHFSVVVCQVDGKLHDHRGQPLLFPSWEELQAAGDLRPITPNDGLMRLLQNSRYLRHLNLDPVAP